MDYLKSQLQQLVSKRIKKVEDEASIQILRGLLHTYTTTFAKDDANRKKYFESVLKKKTQFPTQTVPKSEDLREPSQAFRSASKRRKLLRKKLLKNMRVNTYISDWTLHRLKYEYRSNIILEMTGVIIKEDDVQIFFLPVECEKCIGQILPVTKISHIPRSFTQKKNKNQKCFTDLFKKPISLSKAKLLLCDKVFELPRIKDTHYDQLKRAKHTKASQHRRKYIHLNSGEKVVFTIPECDTHPDFEEKVLQFVSEHLTCKYNKHDGYEICVFSELDCRHRMKFFHTLRQICNFSEEHISSKNFKIEYVSIDTLHEIYEHENKSRNKYVHSWFRDENLQSACSWSKRADVILGNIYTDYLQETLIVNKYTDDEIVERLQAIIEQLGFIIAKNIFENLKNIPKDSFDDFYETMKNITRNADPCLIPSTKMVDKVVPIVHDLYYHYRGYSGMSDEQREYCRIGLVFFDLTMGYFPRKFLNIYEQSGKYIGKNKKFGFGTSCRKYTDPAIKDLYRYKDGELKFAVEKDGTFHSISSTMQTFTNSLNTDKYKHYWLEPKKEKKKTKKRKFDNAPLL